MKTAFMKNLRMVFVPTVAKSFLLATLIQWIVMTDEQAKKFFKRIKISASKFGFAHEAEDCAQEILLRMLEGRHQHSTIDQAVIDYLRRNHGDKRRLGRAKRENFNHAYSYEQGAYDNTLGACPGEQLEQRMDVDRLIRSIRTKGNGQKWRAIAGMFFVGGYTEAEIADHYNVGPTRIHQILKEISGRLSKRIKTQTSRMAFEVAETMERILSIAWDQMEFRESESVAFEAPREMARLNEESFAEWLT